MKKYWQDVFESLRCLFHALNSSRSWTNKLSLMISSPDDMDLICSLNFSKVYESKNNICYIKSYVIITLIT